MGNKLVKQKPKTNHKKQMRLYMILFVVLIVACAAVWIDIILTSQRFDRQLDKMVEGKDYFIEDVTITKKVYYSYTDSYEASYFFYYDDSFQKKMEVNEKVYDEYKVQDKVPAYTTDHIYYSYTKEGILPKTEYKNNELEKVIGVLLGIGVLGLMGLMWLRR